MSYLRNQRPSSLVRGGQIINPPLSFASSHGHEYDKTLNERSLSEVDVSIYNVGGDGICQIRTSLDTSFDGDEDTAVGVAFSVQALDSSLDIQAIEFANPSDGDGSNINIYARKGGNFSTTASDWITLATAATSVVSPDGLGMIVPRAEMKQDMTIAAGEIWTIYIASSTSNIKLISTKLSTGYGYQVDDFLQLNVGEAMSVGAEFSSPRTPGRIFQGRLFYRVLKPCSERSTITEYTFPFATASGIDSTKLKDAVTDGLNKLLTDEADLKRWTQVYGLSIKNVGLKSKGPSEDCSEFNLTDGCDLYDSDVVFGHYESLQERDLILEFLLKLNFRNGLGDLGNGINVTYIGDEVLQQQYDVSMTGIPSATVLNPIQRDYLQQVTLDFFDAFSESKPNRVTIQQSTENRRRHLRSRGSMSSGSRSLQETGNVVKAQTLVYGIGKDHEAFFQQLDETFLSNAKQYMDAVQRQQYFPGEINDEENFGVIFDNITNVNVARSKASEATLPPTTSTSSKDKLDSAQIQIIVFSILIGISFFWLVYRVMKDCILVQDGWAVKKEKLSDKVEREKESTVNRPELSNMDKPRQRASIAIDISSLPEIKVRKDDSSVPSKTSSERAKRRPPPTGRGIGATKSTDDLDMLRPRSNLSSAAPREPTRGVRRAKSNDDDLLFESLSSASTPKSNSREPVRGVGKSKSSDFLNLMKWGAGPKFSEASVASNRSVPRSKSNDLLNLERDKGSASATGGSPTKVSKPASAKKKAKKAKKSSKPESGTTIGSSSHTEEGTKKKRKSSKKDLKVKGKSSKKDLKVNGESSKKDLKVNGESRKKNLKVKGGEESATPSPSPKVSKKQPKKEKRKETGVADDNVAKKKKKPKDNGETKEKRSPKKSSKSPKRSPAASSTTK